MKLLRLLSDLIIKKRNLKRIKNFMKYIVILLLIAFVSNAQITKIKPYALATKYNFDFRYHITKQFKVNIKGNPDARLFKGVTNFLRRLDGRTGLFLEQAYVIQLTNSLQQNYR
jgi:hexosaminidase